MSTLTLIPEAQLRELSTTAASLPRLRKNLNVHPVLEDPIQRLFNAMAPGTYVRPHRHARPNGWELMLAIRGAFAILTFDDAGTVLERAELGVPGGLTAVEIPAHTWHAIVVLAPDTLMFEVKPGPYVAVEDKDFARWAPPEGAADTPRFVDWYTRAQPGDHLFGS